MSTAAPDRRADVLRLLSEAPDGLSDGALARALGPEVRPQSVNALCRRLAGAGVVERFGERPIRNRLVGGIPGPAADARPDDAPPEQTPAPAQARPDDAPPQQTPAPAQARPDDAPVAVPPATIPPSPHVARLVRDARQAWSRTVNVQAALAAWLLERGGTIRSATLDGDAPARDLVVRLGDEDLHVEVTGWPPDGARTHPTTIAGDWFAAAARAAPGRRRAHPRARIVIAVPDTRRYRALATGDGGAGCGAEVWFVDPSGSVETSEPVATALR